MNATDGTPRSALYVPVPEAEAAIGHLRRRHDPTAQAGIPAHISVVVPFLEPRRLVREVYEALESIARSVASFRFDLSAIGTWPQVLWLAPQPNGPFKELIGKVVEQWPDTEPYGGRHSEVVPHLTVGNELDPDTLARLAVLAEDCLPIPAVARAVHLKLLTEGRWRAAARFPLATASSVGSTGSGY